MLSISDWISFLGSEKNPTIGNIASIGAGTLALIVLVMSTISKPWPNVIAPVLIVVALMIYSYKMGVRYAHRVAKAEELLDDIMSGKERDLLRIEARWKAFLEENGQRKKRK